MAATNVSSVQAAPVGKLQVFVLVCRHHSTVDVYTLPSMTSVASFAGIEQGPALAVSQVASAARMRVPEQLRIVEMRMDSYAAISADPSAPPHLGPVPAPDTLQAQQPLLVVRTRDERIFVYRLQLCRAHPEKEASRAVTLCLRRQPCDWLRCAWRCCGVLCCVDGALQRTVHPIVSDRHAWTVKVCADLCWTCALRPHGTGYRVAASCTFSA